LLVGSGRIIDLGCLLMSSNSVFLFYRNLLYHMEVIVNNNNINNENGIFIKDFINAHNVIIS
jgi:hypothetical protein